MTINDALILLLANFAPEERSVPESEDYPGRHAEIIRALNSALQELYGDSAPWGRKGSEGFLLYGPATVPTTVTKGSKSADFAGAWEDRFAGCTCRIAGADTDNQILTATGGVATLLFPHEGTTGSSDITIYHDSISLPPTVCSVLRTVSIKGVCFLSPVGGPASLDGFTPGVDYHFDKRVATVPDYLAKSQYLGAPRLYTVDTFTADEIASPVLRLRISPAPDQRYSLEARVQYAAPNLNGYGADDVLPVPFQYTESILLPIATQLLTASPFFRNAAAIPEIARQYTRALALAKAANPQAASSIRLSPTY